MDSGIYEKKGGGDDFDKPLRLQDVAAIIVTYNPNPEGLQRGLSAIARQVDCVLVVDNASHNLEQCQLGQLAGTIGIKLEVIRQSRNAGLGAGFNAGISFAEKLGYRFVVLFDQDSVPQIGMVSELRESYESLVRRGIRVAAVGPRFFDSDSGQLSQFFPTGDDEVRQSVAGTIQTDFLISSGSLIAMQAVTEVGLMDESLFIDYVDTEWCLRGKSKGWRVYGVDAAIMEHSLGESRRRIWFIRWRNISLHKPFRYYYIFRNSMLLRRRAYVPARWKRANMIHNIMLSGYVLGFTSSRLINLKMIWKGIRDGSKGITGQMSTD